MLLTYVLTGAHGTGKTTLIKELQFLSDQYSFAKSSTRSSGAKLNEGDDESQLTILKAIQQYEIDNDLYKKDYILDRSFIDFYAYSRYFHSIGNLSDSVLDKIKTEFINRKDSYTMVFFLPIEFDIEDDGSRSTDKDFQKSINDHIWSIICEYELGAVIVSGSLVDRVSIIKHHIPYIDKITSKPELLTKIDINDEDELIVEHTNYVMMHHDRVASLVSFKLLDRLKISFVYTDPMYRGCGFAAKLINRLLEDHKNIVVYLYIRFDAIPFYQKLGIDKFIIGESNYESAKPNYYATFMNGDTLLPVELSNEDTSRLKR